MSDGRRTVATVVRVGPQTTLVALSGWYRGQVLAAVKTRELTAATGATFRPGKRLLDSDLAMHGCEAV